MAEIDPRLIKEAVAAIFSPYSSPEARRHAHEFLESLQERAANGYQLVAIGFDLAGGTENPVEIRHCGLQFIEHTVKFGWYNLTAEEKQLIKTGCFGKLALAIPGDPFLESTSGKDSLAKIIVEITKREWPQNWPSFLSECEELCKFFVQVTHFVFLLLLRLIEDVTVLHNVENPTRRKELYNALVVVAPDLLRLSTSILHRYTASFEVEPIPDMRSPEVQVCRYALRLLTSLMDWVLAKDLQAIRSDLLPLLCHLLSLSSGFISVKLEIADCLLQFASRKHNSKQEMLPVLDLFNTTEMTLILGSAKAAADQAADEAHYTLLKAISNILHSLGQALCLLMGHSAGIQTEPSNFGLYLSAQLAFVEHPSVALRFQAVTTLVAFFKHEEIRKCKTLIEMLPAFVQRVLTNIRKVGFPSKNEGSYSTFSSLDYEDDTEFVIAFNRFREQAMTFVRFSIAVDYTVAYRLGKTWFSDVVSRAPAAIDEYDNAEYDLELEAMNRFFNVLFLALSKLEAFQNLKIQNDGHEMLALVLSKLECVKVPWLLNHLLSTASALFPFLINHSNFIPPFIRVIFFCANVTRGPLEKPEDQCKNLRHHSMHEFVRLAVEYTDQLLIYIDDLLPQIVQWSQSISPRQKCCLVEGLAALSNKFKDYARQAAFIADILKDCAVYWTSASLSQAVASPENFMSFIGLSNAAPVTWTDDSPQSAQRREILNACIMLTSVLNRTNLLNDQGVLEQGHFLTEYNGRTVTRHPAFDVFQPLFLNIFSLARCLNGIYTAESIAKVHPSFGGVKAIDVPDVEKYSVNVAAASQVVIGRSDADRMFQKLTMADHMKGFLADLTEQVQVLIGFFASKFKWQFFAVPQASNFLLHGCLGFIDDMLDLRLRMLIKRSFLPIADSIQEFGGDHFRVIEPALAALINAAYNRLQSRWDLVTKRKEEVAKTEQADLTSQEIYLEDLTCLLTREVVQFIHHALLSSPCLGTSQQQVATATADDLIDNGEADEDGLEDVAMTNGNAHSQKSRALSELGEFLCDPKNGCVVPMTLTIFHALSWPDTRAAVRSIPLCEAVTEKLTTNGFLDEQAAVHLFSRALAAIQLHGEHDNAASPLLTLACQLYEKWFQKFPKVREILLMVPDCSPEALKNFDGKVLGSQPSKTIPEKAKKDLFRKLIKSVIGTNIGQQFKRTAHLRDLPALLLPKKSKPAGPSEDMGICNLFAHVDA